MHTQFLIHITICIELLVFLAGLNFLSKVKKDSLGRIYQWLTCLILTLVALVLICTLWAGFSRMCRSHNSKECMEMENCHRGMGYHGMMMGRGECGEMSSCKGMKGYEEKEEGCPFDKKGKCIGDEKKCKEMMAKEENQESAAKDTIATKANSKAKK